MSETDSIDCRAVPYPMGTLLFSMKHGQRVLRKASFMKAGTKCFAAYRGVGSRAIWLPCEELQVVGQNTESAPTSSRILA